MAATTADITSPHERHIFRTALRLIGQGFVEIAQGIGLIAEGTLRPVRSFVPSFVVLASIATLTAATLVLVVTTIARADFPAHSDSRTGATWTRWSHSPEIRFGNNTIRETDLDRLAETDAWAQEPIETTYASLWLSDQ